MNEQNLFSISKKCVSRYCVFNYRKGNTFIPAITLYTPLFAFYRVATYTWLCVSGIL